MANITQAQIKIEAAGNALRSLNILAQGRSRLVDILKLGKIADIALSKLIEGLKELE